MRGWWKREESEEWTNERKNEGIMKERWKKRMNQWKKRIKEWWKGGEKIERMEEKWDRIMEEGRKK